MKLALLFFAALGVARAQDAPPPEAPAPIGVDAIEQQGLRAHATWLADDARGGRYTSTPGQIETAEYVAARFEELGLEPLGDRRSYLQRYPVVRSELGDSTRLVCGGEEFTTGFAVVPGEKTKKLGVRGRLAFAGYGERDAFPPRLERKIPVVVARPRGGEARQVMAARRDLLKLFAIAKEADAHGARVLVVCLLDDGDGLGDALNYSALLPGKPILGFGKKGEEVARPVPIPIVVTSSKVTAAILGALGVEVGQGGAFQGEPADVDGRVDLRVEIDRRAHAVNVCARLPGGSLSREAVVFSAHMDHMGTRLDGDPFNGADDNASGTAGLLEIAEAFATLPEPSKRSVVFLSVSGEELGLWGSQYWSEHPTWPLSKVVANVNIDMIGRNGDLSNEKQVSVTPSFRHAAYSTLVRDAAAIAAQLGLGLTNGDQYFERSDHYHFAKNGVPVVFFCDGEHEDYHRVTDHADKLDFAKMERIARLAFETGRAVADSAKRPETLGEQPDW